jgi:hypothetical protein
MDFRKPGVPGLTQMALGGEVLYEPGHPLSDAELSRRIKRALVNVGWKEAVPARSPSAQQAPGLKPPGSKVSGTLLPVPPAFARGRALVRQDGR